MGRTVPSIVRRRRISPRPVTVNERGADRVLAGGGSSCSAQPRTLPSTPWFRAWAGRVWLPAGWPPPVGIARVVLRWQDRLPRRTHARRQDEHRLPMRCVRSNREGSERRAESWSPRDGSSSRSLQALAHVPQAGNPVRLYSRSLPARSPRQSFCRRWRRIGKAAARALPLPPDVTQPDRPQPWRGNRRSVVVPNRTRNR